MSESIYADELSELGFDEWSEEDGIAPSDHPDFPDHDLPCFFRVEVPNMPLTFAIDEFKRLWAADGLFDLSYLGFTEMEIRDEEEDGEGVPPTEH